MKKKQTEIFWLKVKFSIPQDYPKSKDTRTYVFGAGLTQ